VSDTRREIPDSRTQFVPDSAPPLAIPIDPAGNTAAVPLLAAIPIAGPAAQTNRPQVPGYEILGELGRGGMGVVYKARQLRLNRLVALKMILAGSHAGDADLQRFRTEAEAIARLQHPGIVQVYEVGEHQGKPFFSLEFCSGGSLEKSVAGNPMPPRAAASLVAVLARAVEHAHQHGIIHRDLKPANVLLTGARDEGRGARENEGASISSPLAPHPSPLIPKITDFGLAKKLDVEDGQTRTGAVMGTPSYMAPEQALGNNKEVGPATDIYALGAILYELLTGRPPFKAATALDTLLQVTAEEPLAPSRLQPGTPRDLETICLKCLQKDPSRRYARAADLADDLGCFLEGRPIRARSVGLAERGWRWCRRNPALAGSLGLVAVLLLIIGVGSSLSAWSLKQALDRSEQHRLEAERQHQEAVNARARETEKLWESYLAQAEAGRFSRRPGQRFQSLEALRKAAEIKFTPRLRDLALASLVLPDVRLVREWDSKRYPALAVDPNGRFYTHGEGITQAVVRRCDNDAEVARIIAPQPVVGTALSLDGQSLLVFLEGRIGQVWRLGEGKPRLVLKETQIAEWNLLPDGRRLVIRHDDLSLAVHELADGQLLHKHTLPEPPTSIAFARDGKKLAFSGKDRRTIRLLDLDSGQVSEGITVPGQLQMFSWHPDGKTLAVSMTFTGEVVLWDLTTRQPVRHLEQLGGATVGYFNATGDLLVSLSAWAGGIRLWDPGTGRLLLSMPGSGLVFNEHAPDGRLFAMDIKDGKWRRWEINPGREYRTLTRALGADNQFRFDASQPALSPDGRLVALTAVIERGWGVLIWDLVSQCEVALLPGASGPVFEPSGDLVTAGPKVRRWPIRRQGGDPLVLRIGPPQLLPADGFRLAAVSRDGKVLAAANLNAGATVLFKDPARAPLALGPQNSVWSMDLRGDGRLLATGSWHADDVRIWELPTGRVVHHINLCQARQTLFSPDGRLLAMALHEANANPAIWIHVFDTMTWKRVQRFDGNRVAFSPDSAVMAVDKNDGTAQLLETATGRELARLDDPFQDRFAFLAFSPDGRQLITANTESKSLHIWDLYALRRQLAELRLDWQAPPYRPRPAGQGVLPPSFKVDLRLGKGK